MVKLEIYVKEKKSPEYWERFEDDLRDWLEARELNGRIEDEHTGNSTVFSTDPKPFESKVSLWEEKEPRVHKIEARNQKEAEKLAMEKALKYYGVNQIEEVNVERVYE